MALRPRLNQTVSERRNGSVGIICSPFNDWRKKKISGRRCAKGVIDAGAFGICSAIGGVIHIVALTLIVAILPSN